MCTVWHYPEMCEFLILLFLASSIFITNERRLWYQAVLCQVQPLQGFSLFDVLPFSSMFRTIQSPGRSLQFSLGSGFGHFHCFFVALGLLTNNTCLFIVLIKAKTTTSMFKYYQLLTDFFAFGPDCNFSTFTLGNFFVLSAG